MSSSVESSFPFRPDEAFARQLDDADTLSPLREKFRLPAGEDGEPAIYFCGNSLGLQPVAARGIVEEELSTWARLGVEGHFAGTAPWYDYHRRLTAGLARLAGALPREVVAMNSLTVNLHLMMTSFYRPTPARHKVLMEDGAFPSDSYAVQSHLRNHGFDPAAALLVARPRPGEDLLRADDLLSLLEEKGGEIALVLLGAVNYVTGQAFDSRGVAQIARRQGCAVGLDLAHAIGNIPLALHDWDVDFAVWCSYKYLNGGPGAAGGCFVHERHARAAGLPRLAGWWGNDPATRFEMRRVQDFIPAEGAEGWQVSNPPILAMAPLRAALDRFDEAGMDALREKSIRLTGYLEALLDRIPGNAYRILTPRDPGARGCQLSVRTRVAGRALVQALREKGLVADFREPDVLRLAPVPLYNRFTEAYRAACILEQAAASS